MNGKMYYPYPNGNIGTKPLGSEHQPFIDQQSELAQLLHETESSRATLIGKDGEPKGVVGAFATEAAIKGQVDANNSNLRPTEDLEAKLDLRRKAANGH